MRRAGGGVWRMWRPWMGVGLVAAAGLAPASAVAGQGLADFDYENLRLRGVGLEAGWIVPTDVESTATYGMRLDLGYLGPGLRIVPSFTYWSSSLERSEVQRLERRVAELIADQGGGDVQVDLGEIDWSDLVLSVDGHFVWSIPFGALSYLGAGGSAHILNGEGPAISDTFVEDLLDSVTAGINVHGGLEYPIVDRFRVYGEARYEALGDFQYGALKLGGQVLFTAPEPGERRGG